MQAVHHPAIGGDWTPASRGDAVSNYYEVNSPSPWIRI